MWAFLGRTGVGRARSQASTSWLATIAVTAMWAGACQDGLADSFEEPDSTSSILLEAPANGDVTLGLPSDALPAAGSAGIVQGIPFAGDDAWLPAAFVGSCQNHGNRLADCDPLGLAQRLVARHNASGACWTLRADALILWRDAPAVRPLYTANPAPPTLLDASQLESPAAGGGRVQLLSQDACGNGFDVGYLYGGQFFSQQALPFNPGAYLTAPPGLDGIDPPPALRSLDQVDAKLTGSIMSGEINRRVGLWPAVRFLYGFRWFQWYETSLITDGYTDPISLGTGTDIYSTSTINNLWGGQIGFDALLLRTRHNFRIEGLVKAGAYANNASQSSQYIQLNDGLDPFQSQVSVKASPASCSFAGEVGLTGVLPISNNWDFRFGYLGLWLTGLAQPTNQLSGQNLAQGVDPPTGTLNTAGTVIVQGVTLGLEGRW